jgi:hypothetical protein
MCTALNEGAREREREKRRREKSIEVNSKAYIETGGRTNETPPPPPPSPPNARFAVSAVEERSCLPPGRFESRSLCLSLSLSLFETYLCISFLPSFFFFLFFSFFEKERERERRRMRERVGSSRL